MRWFTRYFNPSVIIYDIKFRKEGDPYTVSGADPAAGYAVGIDNSISNVFSPLPVLRPNFIQQFSSTSEQGGRFSVWKSIQKPFTSGGRNFGLSIDFEPPNPLIDPPDPMVGYIVGYFVDDFTATIAFIFSVLLGIYTPLGSLANINLLDRKTVLDESVHGSVFRTIDGGKTWNYIDTFDRKAKIYSKVVVFKDFAYILDSLGEVHRIRHDSDTADRIRVVFVSGPGKFVFNLTIRYTCMFFVNEQIGFVGDSHGRIYKTVDGGLHWSLSLHVSEDIFFKDIYFLNEQKGFVIGREFLGIEITSQQTSEGVIGIEKRAPAFYMTNDGGNTWIRIANDKIVHSDIFVSANKIKFVNDSLGFIVGGINKGNKELNAQDQAQGFFDGFVWRTRDGGETWGPFPNDPDPMIFAGHPKELYSIDFSNDLDMHVVGQQNIFRSHIDLGTKTVSFHITKVMNNVKSILFGIRNKIANFFSLRFHITKVISNIKSILFSIQFIISNFLPIIFDLREHIPKSVPIKFDLRNIRSNAKSILFDLRQIFSKFLPIQFDLRQLIIRANTILFDLRQIFSDIKLILFDLRNLISSSKIFLFDLRNLVLNSRAILFDIHFEAFKDTIGRIELVQTTNFNGAELFWRDFSLDQKFKGIQTYIILRRQEGENIFQEIGRNFRDKLRFLDENLKGGRKYFYALQGELETQTGLVTTDPTDEVELMSIPDRIEGIDIIQGRDYIEIKWEPCNIYNLSPTFQGYNIYRSVNDNDFEIINNGFYEKTNYRDNDVVPGNRYRYFVTIADNSFDRNERFDKVEGNVEEQIRYKKR